MKDSLTASRARECARDCAAVAAVGGEVAGGDAVRVDVRGAGAGLEQVAGDLRVGINPIVTLEKQVLNMIVNMV